MSANRRHIAMFTPLGSGHVYPTLGLCCELVRRGHRVTYATNSFYAEKVRQAGGEPALFTPPEIKNAEKVFRYPCADDPRFWSLFASLFLPRLLTAAAVVLAELKEFYKENVPDLILYDHFSFAGRILARQLGSPAIQLWPHFAHQGYLIRENGVLSNPEPMLGFAQLLDSFLSAHDIPGNGHLWHKEALNIYFVPREFQFHGDSFDDRFCFAGACLNRPAPVGWKNQSRDRPIILVAESTTSQDGDYFKACIEAFAGSEYHVVLSTGGNSPRDLFSVLPANIEINEHAYNVEILPHAALTVCQAGMGTTLESLYHGVPVLAVPHTAYHAEVAYRVGELGLGAHLPKRNVSMEALRENVDRILGDAALIQRVKSTQQVFKRSNGAAMAADRIEKFLSCDCST